VYSNTRAIPSATAGVLIKIQQYVWRHLAARGARKKLEREVHAPSNLPVSNEEPPPPNRSVINLITPGCHVGNSATLTNSKRVRSLRGRVTVHG